MLHKTCIKCKEDKSYSNFSKDKYHPTGHKNLCKPCSSIAFKLWRSKNKERALHSYRVSYYVRKYKLSVERARELVKDRTGVCTICEVTTKLVVDHCHTTGKVRGMICGACNSLLGYSRDNTDTLRAAIKYLKDFYEE